MNISFSAIDTWRKCPFSFKLKYKDKIDIPGGSIHSAYGTSMHDTIKNVLNETIKDEEIENHFKNSFKEEIKTIPKEKKEKIFQNKEEKETLVSMTKLGPNLCRQAIAYLSEKYPGFEIVQAEQEFIEPILIDSKESYDFKGIIDLIFKMPDNSFHILDWKNCSWGWKAEKKSSKWTTYQLTYYKHYFALQNNIDPNNIVCSFALIKRTAKKDNIEIFDVKVGPQKTKNALKVINNLIYTSEKNHFPKNRLSCTYCDYHRTQWCP